MPNHLLVTNDFPPRIGGIQSYLYELWRRLPAHEVTVLTTAQDGAESWDAAQLFRIERIDSSFLAPTPGLIGRINDLAAEVQADLVLLDPAWPVGAIGPHLARPFGLVLHGSEVTVPARLPFVQLALRRTMRRARLVIAAGGYPLEQGRYSAGRDVPAVVIPPGVDVERFHPLDLAARREVRSALGLDPDATIVLGISRLVPRKGFDVLIRAAAQIAEEHPAVRVVIGGEGRDRERLETLASGLGAPVTFLGAIAAEHLPGLYAASDVFAMLCRDRWLGLEQEGFGIVFLEAAAAGVPSVAGRSGGSAEAVVDGETGIVVADATSVDEVAEAILSLLDDADRRSALGAAARVRAAQSFSYDSLARELHAAIGATITEIASEIGASTAADEGANAGAEASPVPPDHAARTDV